MADALLWFQLSPLLLAFPCLVLTVVGLGTGDPWWVAGELTLVAVVGIVPAFMVQWRRPVVIMPWQPLEGVTLPCRWWAGLATREHQVVTLLVGILMLALNRTLYTLAPLFSGLSPIREAGGSHLTGLLLAVAGFVGLNFAMQISAAAGRILLLSDDEHRQLPETLPEVNQWHPVSLTPVDWSQVRTLLPSFSWPWRRSQPAAEPTEPAE
ncbi:MAG: hypothetical protein OHK0012_10430 [Synechococcales cyanobacterium]